MRKPPTIVLILSLACAACGAERETHDPFYDRLERLAFVAPGPCLFLPEAGGGIDCSTSEALLVDRFEVTRSEWLEWLGTSGLDPGAFPPEGLAWSEKTLGWPATWMNRAEAEAFAEARGLRLLTAAEWMRVASGTRAQRWPWSAQDIQSVTNNLELGLARPAPVGCFELGATPQGVHDLVGNVAEWVSGVLPRAGEEGAATSSTQAAWVMGGSYLSHKRPLHSYHRARGSEFNAEELHPAHRAVDVGLRLAAGAESYLRDRLGARRPGAAELERLHALGARWGPAAVSLLEELAETTGGAPGILALLAGARG